MAHPLTSQVEEKIKSAPVVIFMKGTPDFPQCGFSSRACQVLKEAGADSLLGVNVLERSLIRIKDFTPAVLERNKRWHVIVRREPERDQ